MVKEFTMMGKKIKVFNPSNGKVISSINCASKNIIEKAIYSSQKAFEMETLFNCKKN